MVDPSDGEEDLGINTALSLLHKMFYFYATLASSVFNLKKTGFQLYKNINSCFIIVETRALWSWTQTITALSSGCVQVGTTHFKKRMAYLYNIIISVQMVTILDFIQIGNRLERKRFLLNPRMRCRNYYFPTRKLVVLIRIRLYNIKFNGKEVHRRIRYFFKTLFSSFLSTFMYSVKNAESRKSHLSKFPS